MILLFFFSYYFNTAATTATITTTTSPPAVPVPVLFIAVVVSTSATIILRLPLLHLQGAPTLFNSFYFPSCILPSVFVSYYLFHTSTLPSRFPLTVCLSFFISTLPFPFFTLHIYTPSLLYHLIQFISHFLLFLQSLSLSLYFTSLLP